MQQSPTKSVIGADELRVAVVGDDVHLLSGSESDHSVTAAHLKVVLKAGGGDGHPGVFHHQLHVAVCSGGAVSEIIIVILITISSSSSNYSYLRQLLRREN